MSTVRKQLGEMFELSVDEIRATMARQASSLGPQYAQTAFGIIALRGKVANPEHVMRLAGVSENTLKNARRLVQVYDDFIERGYATMEWLYGVNYMDAVALNRVVNRGLKMVVIRKGLLTGREIAWREIEFLAETGQTFEEARNARAS